MKLSEESRRKPIPSEREDVTESLARCASKGFWRAALAGAAG